MNITRVVQAESEREESPLASEADSDNLEDVEDSADDLVEEDKIPPTMFIGPSLVSNSTIGFYEQSGFSPKGMAQALGTKSTLEPDTDQTAVFYEFFLLLGFVFLGPYASRNS